MEIAFGDGRLQFAFALSEGLSLLSEKGWWWVLLIEGFRCLL